MTARADGHFSQSGLAFGHNDGRGVAGDFLVIFLFQRL